MIPRHLTIEVTARDSETHDDVARYAETWLDEHLPDEPKWKLVDLAERPGPGVNFWAVTFEEVR